MTVANYELLLLGNTPSLEDYSQFISVCEKSPSGILWLIALKFTNLHFILKKVLQKNIEEKIQEENINQPSNK